MTNESPFRKNRAFYIGVVLTVLEGILSGCSYLSVYIVLTALASGTITAGMVGAVTAGLAVIFLLRLVIYSTPRSRSAGRRCPSACGCFWGISSRRSPWPASPRGRLAVCEHHDQRCGQL